MQAEEFQHILQLGLGRAVLYLEGHESTPYKHLILHDCLHSTVYDNDSEGNKARYLYEIIQITGEETFYREKILNAFATIPTPAAYPDSVDYDDASLLFSLAFEFAKQGDEEARQLLYLMFAKRATQTSDLGAETLIRLDGIDGFRFVARHLYNIIEGEGEDKQLDDWFITVAEETCGKDALTQYVEQERINDKKLCAYIQYPRRDNSQRDRNNNREKASYDEIKQSVTEWNAKYREEGEFPYAGLAFYNFRGKKINDDAILALARDLLNENDERSLLPYLTIFSERRFPLEHDKLLQLAKHANEHLAFKAIMALRNIQHSSVHELALKLIESNCSALELFVHNYQDGDHIIIERVLVQQTDIDYFHNAGWIVTKIFKNNPTSDCLGALTQIYERGPCAHCRKDAIKILVKQEILPDWMRQECAHDSNLAIRDLVKNHL